MTAPKIALVPPPRPKAKPRLSKVTPERIGMAHPNNPEHARRWARAVAFLRTRTTRGWILDTPTKKEK